MSLCSQFLYPVHSSCHRATLAGISCCHFPLPSLLISLSPPRSAGGGSSSGRPNISIQTVCLGLFLVTFTLALPVRHHFISIFFCVFTVPVILCHFHLISHHAMCVNVLHLVLRLVLIWGLKGGGKRRGRGSGVAWYRNMRSCMLFARDSQLQSRGVLCGLVLIPAHVSFCRSCTSCSPKPSSGSRMAPFATPRALKQRVPAIRSILNT